MSKLSLNLDDLSVDSFAPDTDAASRSGTVHGQIRVGETDNFDYCFQTNVGCGPGVSDDCANETDDTCYVFPTVKESCNGTCRADTCLLSDYGNDFCVE